VTSLRSKPEWCELVVLVLSGLVIYHYAASWVFGIYVAGTALWLATFLYGTVQRRTRKEGNP
jgi:hypothetical protein